MIKKIFKLLIVLLIPLTLTSLSFAADTKEERKKIVKQLKTEIVELGEKPIKKKFLQGTSDYIVILKEQRDELLKEKELKESIEDGLSRKPNWNTLIKIKNWLDL